MIRYRSLLILSFTAAGILLGSTLAKADPYTLTLSAPFQYASQSGDVLEFDATFTNNTSDLVYLNSDSITLDSPLLTLDDTAFVTTFAYDSGTGNYDVGPGDSFTGELFTVSVSSGAPIATYDGDFAILGGSDTNGQDVLASADFNVEVTPEPASWELMAMGLMGLLAVAFSRSNRRLTAV